MLHGCTMHQPMQPPRPELAKMTGLERGAGAVMGDFVAADIVRVTVSCGSRISIV